LGQGKLKLMLGWVRFLTVAFGQYLGRYFAKHSQDFRYFCQGTNIIYTNCPAKTRCLAFRNELLPRCLPFLLVWHIFCDPVSLCWGHHHRPRPPPGALFGVTCAQFICFMRPLWGSAFGLGPPLVVCSVCFT